MTRWMLAAAAFAAVSAPLAAQPAAKADLVPVAIETSLGRIVVALDRGRAPKTADYFLRYVDGGRLDGENFYRAMRYPDGGGLIQGGITSDSRKLLKPVEHEPVSQTGISHVAGTISLANAGPGTATSDFFILASDSPSFDSDFAAFGRVTEGMDVVKAILAAPTSPTRGEGIMKGQMLEPGVKIVKATRVERSQD